MVFVENVLMYGVADAEVCDVVGIDLHKLNWCVQTFFYRMQLSVRI